MLKEYKYYSVNVNLTDGKGRLCKVKVIINNGSAFNLMYTLLVNWRKLLNKEYKEAIPIWNKEGGLY